MKFYDAPLPQTSEELNTLVREWVACLDLATETAHANAVCMALGFELPEEHPALGWKAILLAIDLAAEPQLGTIGAGALENLLASHPATYIPLAEEQALKSHRFRMALAHVWQNKMPIDHWERLIAFCKAHPEWNEDEKLEQSEA